MAIKKPMEANKSNMIYICVICDWVQNWDATRLYVITHCWTHFTFIDMNANEQAAKWKKKLKKKKWKEKNKIEWRAREEDGEQGESE